MDAEQVVAKILSEAKAEGEKIVSEARDKSASQQARLTGRLTAYEKETQTLTVRAAEDKTRRMLAAARMEIRKDVLARKVSLLDEVFKNAQSQIQSLGDDDYGKLITSLMLKAVETGDEKVVVGKNERRIDDRLIKNINRQLGTGFKGNLQLSQTRANIDGGFILARRQMQINVSVEVLLSQARADMEMELATELFAED